MGAARRTGLKPSPPSHKQYDKIMKGFAQWCLTPTWPTGCGPAFTTGDLTTFYVQVDRYNVQDTEINLYCLYTMHYSGKSQGYQHRCEKTTATLYEKAGSCNPLAHTYAGAEIIALHE
ncbi:hypothetical protein O988_07870 [Pseudogymnoascus sp. VKM F-3808]|nr:hypothetical protein O988_07870 [Pseudogymnoascus sp. VKM F-3808]